MSDYRQLMESGLYKEATEERLLISHKETQEEGLVPSGGMYLLPDQIRTISYPYEWSFSQLKDAALAVLDLQELAISKGMSLKDATAYNVQFHAGRPVHIDTSSFEKYEEGAVWMAYRQFCEHFLAPLLLMSRVDVRLGRLQATYIDGIPIDLAASLVPGKTWFNPWLSMHVRMHGKAKKEASGASKKSAPQMTKNALLGLITSLRQAVNALKLEEKQSEWSDYSSASSYDADAAAHKHELVAEYLRGLEAVPKLVWDLGANAGEFSRIFSEQGIDTVAWDGDPAAVDRNYRQVAAKCESHLLPLVQDFSNPSPGLGWENSERAAFLKRGPADVVLALALIHHLVIGNSVPLPMTADFFAKTGRYLIIEFVDPEDPRVVQLLSTRSDSHEYSCVAFEQAFHAQFELIRKDLIRNSKRTLYLMRKKA